MTMQAMATNQDSGRPPRPKRLLRLPQVLDRIGLGKTVLYERVKDGRFPKPFKQGGNINFWREDEVDAYIERLTKRRDGVHFGRSSA